MGAFSTNDFLIRTWLSEVCCFAGLPACRERAWLPCPPAHDLSSGAEEWGTFMLASGDAQGWGPGGQNRLCFLSSLYNLFKLRPSECYMCHPRTEMTELTATRKRKGAKMPAGMVRLMICSPLRSQLDGTSHEGMKGFP